MILKINCAGANCSNSLTETVQRGHYSLLDILARNEWRAIDGGYLCNSCSAPRPAVPDAPRPTEAKSHKRGRRQ
jgi:hypothetical protein